MVLCSTGRHNTKHRILLVELDGTFGLCVNVRENRFTIKADHMSFVWFHELSQDDADNYQIKNPLPKLWEPISR